MKKHIFSIIIFSFLSSSTIGYAQVGINTTTPDPSSILDINSNTKGILFPRMTTTERNAIINPATGLLIYDNQLNGFYGYNGTAWTQDVFSGTKWSTAGNTGITANDFLGTLDNTPLSFRANNATAMSINTDGQVSIGGSSLNLPRMIVSRPNPGTSYPALLAVVENDAGEAYPISITTGNSAGAGRIYGSYSFASSTPNANTGTSIGGISYTTSGAASSGGGGIVFYTGGHPNNNNDTTKEALFISASKNVYVGYPSFSTGALTLPASKLNVRGGDVYIETLGSGVILTSPNGSCYKVTIDNAGALQTNTITCP